MTERTLRTSTFARRVTRRHVGEFERLVLRLGRAIIGNHARFKSPRVVTASMERSRRPLNRADFTPPLGPTQSPNSCQYVPTQFARAFGLITTIVVLDTGYMRREDCRAGAAGYGDSHFQIEFAAHQ